MNPVFVQKSHNSKTEGMELAGGNPTKPNPHQNKMPLAAITV